MRIRKVIPGSRNPADRRAPFHRRWPMGDRSGQVLALFAVAAVPLMAMLALGIDVGVILTARDEAQRAADAGALAGASVFQGCKLLECAALADDAENKAVDYATGNRIRDIPIDASEVHVQVMTDERKVRVFVDREGVSTFFAHLLGVPVVPIGAVAAAKVSSGGTAQCLLPLFGPDLWAESGDANQIPDEDEAWEWESPPDTYQPVAEDGSGTGYGSDHRDGEVGDDGFSYTGDLGRRFVIKATSQGQGKGKNQASMPAPGNFQLWLPPIPSGGSCDEPVTANPSQLGDLLSGATCSCPIDLTQEHEFDTKPGMTHGQVKDLEERIALDPDAQWLPDENRLDSEYGESSPRVVAIALSPPASLYGLKGKSQQVQFNNFAKVFIEDPELGAGGDKIVYARFMGFVQGSGGPITGNLIEYLRLVE